MGEDEGGFDDGADLAGAGGDVVEGAPAAGEYGEAAFRLGSSAVRAGERCRCGCLATLVEELDDECARLAALSALGPEANVRTVFSWSYRQIDGIEAAVFRAVGLGPGRGFDAATIAAIAGRSHDSVERALAHLDRAHLVTDLGNRRYGMHDLLHAYASEVARADHDPHPAEARHSPTSDNAPKIRNCGCSTDGYLSTNDQQGRRTEDQAPELINTPIRALISNC